MKRLCAMLLAVAMMLSLAACGGGNTSESSAPETGAGTASTETADGSAPAETGDTAPTVVDSGDPVYGGSATFLCTELNTVFDPALGESYTYDLWNETLWCMDWGLNDPDTYSYQINLLTESTMAGQIADSWEWTTNGDGTSDLAVTIRDDVYFQSKEGEYDIFGGRNLTASDVAYSYDRVLGTGTCKGKDPVMIEDDWVQRMSGLIDTAAEEDPIEVTGDYTLVFHLVTESEARLSEFMLAMVNITGPEWDELTDDQKSDWHYAIGTGPYILTDFVAGSYYKYTKNENYYDYDERHPENKLPYLDTITYTAVTDTAAAMSSFIAGDLDFISSYAYLSDDQTQQLITVCGDDLRDLLYPASAQAIDWKCNQEPFNDINVRIALQKAINLEEVNSAYYGYSTDLQYAGLWASPLTTWSSTADWDDELLGEYSYDPEAAKQMLADAGYPNGFEFTVLLGTTADQDLYQLAKSYLAEVGVTMNIEIASDGLETRSVQGDQADTRQVNQEIGMSTDAGFAFQTYCSTGFAYHTFDSDTTMDGLLTNTRDALTLEEQAVAAKEADLEFAKLHWSLQVGGMTQTHEFLSSRIGGLDNGELISAYYLNNTIVARLWAIDGQ